MAGHWPCAIRNQQLSSPLQRARVAIMSTVDTWFAAKVPQATSWYPPLGPGLSFEIESVFFLLFVMKTPAPRPLELHVTPLCKEKGLRNSRGRESAFYQHQTISNPFLRKSAMLPTGSPPASTPPEAPSQPIGDPDSCSTASVIDRNCCLWSPGSGP